jgi:uncharacterized membrane protein YhaH (DUF805 family)
MSFVEAIEAAYANYLNFSGRATRAAYWYFVLWVSIVTVAFVVFAALGVFYYKTVPTFGYISFIMGGLCGILTLANIIPGYSAQVRRLHDMGRGGGWVGWPLLLNVISQIIDHANKHPVDLGLLAIQLVLLLALVVIGLIVFVFLVQPSKDLSNPFASR